MQSDKNPAMPRAQDFEALLAKGPNASQIETQILAPLGQFLFGTDVLARVELTGQNEFANVIKAYNQALLKLQTLSPQSATLKEQLQTFERFVLAPCAINPKDCGNFKIFATRDSATTDVILMLTQSLTMNAQRAWAYTLYAMDFSSGGIRPETKKKILANLEAHIRTFKPSATQQSLQESRDLGARANQIMMLFGENSPEIGQLAERLDIFSEAADRSSVDPVVRAAVRDSLRSALFKHWVVRDRRFTPSFSRLSEERLKIFNKEVTLVLRATPATLRVFKAFDLKEPLSISKELTFVLDQTFRGQLTQVEGLQLLDQLNPDMRTMSECANAYLSARFAAAVIQSHRDLKGLIGDPNAYVDLEKLRANLLKANPVEINWAKFIERASHLSNLMDGHFTNRNLSITDPIRTSVTRKFGSLTREIAWMASYPTMLPIVYYLSKSKFNQTFYTPWGRFELKSDYILEGLMSGQVGPWLNFTNSASIGTVAISVPEVVVAFRNALNGQLFSEFAIEPSDFLLEMYDRLVTPINVVYDQYNEALHSDLFLDNRNNPKKQLANNPFLNATEFCQGRETTENLPLTSLEKTLIGYHDTVLNQVGDANIYTQSSQVVGGKMNMAEGLFLDRMRTNEGFRVEILEKLREIYRDYLKFHQLSDDRLKLLDEKLAEYHNKRRLHMGLVYFAYNRQKPCVLKLADLNRERMLKTMQYEFMYLRQAHRDLVTLQQEPQKLATVNARYQKIQKDLNLPSKDGFENRHDGLNFRYSKADFLMRVRDYLAIGYTDPQTGQTYPAIAPNLKINMPVKIAQVESSGLIEFFIKNTQVLFMPAAQLQDETAFLRLAMSVFYNSPASKDSHPLVGVEPFSKWIDSEVGKQFILAFGELRIRFEGPLLKIGATEGYDFERPGCKPLADPKDLNKNCLRKFQVTPDDLIDYQKQVFQRVSLTPDVLELLKWTNTSSMYGHVRAWPNYFYNPVSGNAMGALDPYLFMASQPVMVDHLTWPGEAVTTDSRVMDRVGWLAHAQSYFTVFGDSDGQILSSNPAVNGQVFGFYKNLVTREFSLSRQLEAAAAREEASSKWPIPVKIETFSPAYKVPVRTSYVQPSSVREQEFHRSTGFIFTK